MSPAYNSLKCCQCNCTESMLWKAIGDNQQMCNDCFEQGRSNGKQDSDATNNRKSDDRKLKVRKSTRSTRYNGKNGNSNTNASGQTTSNSSKSSSTKLSGRGRRNLFKKPPVKAPTIPATTKHVESLFYKVIHFNIPLQNTTL